MRRRRQGVPGDLMRKTRRWIGLRYILSYSVFDALERSFWVLLDILGSGFRLGQGAGRYRRSWNWLGTGLEHCINVHIDIQKA